MSEKFIVKILKIEVLTHDVKKFTVEKPHGYNFLPGQATLVSVNKPGWEDKRHEFTFTSLGEDPFLEFIIKGYPVSQYPDHKGVTELIHKLKAGDELLIGSRFGTINYKGPGIFIAGGAGITPFIAIIKDLHKKGEIGKNMLMFSNKTREDIILEKWLKNIFTTNNLIFTLTREKAPGYEQGRVDELFLKFYLKSFETNFYLCGPTKMVNGLRETLKLLGAKSESVTFEE